MNYISLNIAFSDDLQAEILTAELADYPFESFEADAGTLKAYIPQERLADCKGEVDALLAHYGVQGRYIAIETQNWNAVWESNFPPVDVEGRLLIRAPFHEPAPAGVMGRWSSCPRCRSARGTTRPPGSCRVPCSTWVSQAVAGSIWAAVRVCCRSSLPNAVPPMSMRSTSTTGPTPTAARTSLRTASPTASNRCWATCAASPDGITALSWPISTAISSRPTCPAYAAALEPGGDLVMSGFLEQDVPAIVACAGELGLRPVATAAREGWMMVHVRKG